jgi:adenylate kinase family enzyme
MKRVIVIGSGGAGKSTFARKLAGVTGLPLIHLDRLYWRPGWIETPRDEWERIVRETVAGDEWIIDGNFGGTMEIRLGACDTVVLLDVPRFTCIRRAIKRRVTHIGRSRPDMADGCNEKIDFEYLLWLWRFPNASLRELERRLAGVEGRVRIVRLRSDRETEEFLANARK